MLLWKILWRKVRFSLVGEIFFMSLTLKLPLKRGPRHPLALKLIEDDPEVVFVNV